MKKTITSWEFIDAFDNANRSNHFSEEGRYALFEYLEELEKDMGKEIELDIIAFCCEYSEMTYLEFAESYGLTDLIQRYNEEEIDEDEFKREIEEYVTKRSAFIKVDEEKFIFSNF